MVRSSIVNAASCYCAVLLSLSAEVRWRMNNTKMREDVRAIQVPMNLKCVHIHTHAEKVDRVVRSILTSGFCESGSGRRFSGGSSPPW